MVSIAVIDYDMGNLHSACKGLEKAGATPHVTDSAHDLFQADAVILPGVGAFDPAIQHLRTRDLIQPIKDVVASNKPFLGICLGLQILLDESEEGVEPGLGIIPGIVRRFQPEPDLTIPHMGWNHLDRVQPALPLWADIQRQSWFYFVHSYYAAPSNPEAIAATVTHGSQVVTAAIAHKNVMATQFHPEKSSTSGLQVLANFVQMVESQCLAVSA
ncbi:MAG: imidazole glycerol phosphate synthase subunit HisH [Cyanobacteria bacterium J06627_8]